MESLSSLNLIEALKFDDPAILSINASSIDLSNEDVLKEVCYYMGKTYYKENLDFENCGISFSGGSYFGDAIKINKRIYQLNLSRNPLSSAGIESFADGLSFNTELKELYLSETNITEEFEKTKGLLALSESFLKNKTLKKLDLSKNLLSDFDENVTPFKNLITNMSKTNAIKILNLSYCSLLTKSMQVLRECLINEKWTSLVELTLSGNGIGSEGIGHLSILLENNKNLKILNLSFNNITDSGVNNSGFISFCSAITRNNSLTNLDLRHNNLSDDIEMFSENSLRRNSSITTFNIAEGNNLSLTSLQSISDKVSSNKDVFRVIKGKLLANEKDTLQRSALFRAVLANSEAGVEILISKKSNLNDYDLSGCTALMHAVSNGNGKICAMLVKGGANINARDSHGNSCLHKAIQRQDHAVCSILIELGIDLKARNNIGISPIDYSSSPSLSMSIKLRNKRRDVWILNSYHKEAISCANGIGLCLMDLGFSIWIDGEADTSAADRDTDQIKNASGAKENRKDHRKLSDFVYSAKDIIKEQAMLDSKKSPKAKEIKSPKQKDSVIKAGKKLKDLEKSVLASKLRDSLSIDERNEMMNYVSSLIFIMEPASLSSPRCLKVLEKAVKNGTKIIAVWVGLWTRLSNSLDNLLESAIKIDLTACNITSYPFDSTTEETINAEVITLLSEARDFRQNVVLGDLFERCGTDIDKYKIMELRLTSYIVITHGGLLNSLSRMIADSFRKANINVYLDDTNLPPSSSRRNLIFEAIKYCKVFVPVLSIANENFSNYQNSLCSIEKQIKFAELNRIPVMPITASSISDPKIAKLLSSKNVQQLLTHPDSFKVSIIEDMTQLAKEIRAVSSNIDSLDARKDTISNSFRNIPICFDYSISRCVQDVKCTIGGDASVEENIRKAYSERVTEVLKCQETILQQNNKVSFLRKEIEEKNDTITELRHVINILSTGADLSSLAFSNITNSTISNKRTSISVPKIVNMERKQSERRSSVSSATERRGSIGAIRRASIIKYASWRKQIFLTSPKASRLLKEIERVEYIDGKIVTSSILHGYAQSFPKDALLKLLQVDYSTEINLVAAVKIQSLWRGYFVRHSRKVNSAKIIQRTFRRYILVKHHFVKKINCFPQGWVQDFDNPFEINK